MNEVGIAGYLYLVLVCLWVPYLALKSAYRLRGGAPLPLSRSRFFISTAFMLTFLFLVAAATAWREWIDIRSLPLEPAKSWSYAALFLVILVVALRLRWKTRPLADRTRLNAILPQNGREFGLYAIVCLAAGVGEEVVYRGVLTTILWRLTNSLIIAILIAVTVFAVSHAVQGWRAVISIFFLSIGAHALVIVSHSLIPMMAVHTLYDALAGYLAPRWYRAELNEMPPVAAPA